MSLPPPKKPGPAMPPKPSAVPGSPALLRNNSIAASLPTPLGPASPKPPAFNAANIPPPKPLNIPPPIAAHPRLNLPSPVASPKALNLPPPLASPNTVSSPSFKIPKPISSPHSSMVLPPPIASPTSLPPQIDEKSTTPTNSDPLDLDYLNDEDDEPSENTMNEAAIMIQKAVRYWKQRKSYKELYEKRKWTLHKEGNVLTNHATKSRVSGRPGRRPPTRGKRVVGLEKPTYEPPPREEPEETSDGSQSTPKRERPKSTASLGGIIFDPTAVKLKATPTSTREDQPASAPGSPLLERIKLRPTSMSPGLLQSLEDKKSKTSSLPAPITSPKGIPPPKPSGMPAKPTGGMPPKPTNANLPVLVKQLSGMPAKPLSGTSFEGKKFTASDPVFLKDGEDSSSELPDLPKPEIPTTERAPVDTGIDKIESEKKKKSVGKILTNFLQRRPAKETLIEKGVLIDEGGNTSSPVPSLQRTQSEQLKEKERPPMQTGNTCMDFRCKKKAKKQNNCYRCGKIFCKNCIHPKKQKLPELQYTKPVPICKACVNERQAELLKANMLTGQDIV